MSASRGDVAVETLLKIVLGLAIVWLALEVVETVLAITFRTVRFAFALLGPLIVLAIVVLIVLWLTDRL